MTGTQNRINSTTCFFHPLNALALVKIPAHAMKNKNKEIAGLSIAIPQRDIHLPPPVSGMPTKKSCEK